MATPTDVAVWRNEAATQGTTNEIAQLRATVNNLVDSLRLLTAKLDADAGVTDSNYVALITDAPVATAPAKIVA